VGSIEGKRSQGRFPLSRRWRDLFRPLRRGRTATCPGVIGRPAFCSGGVPTAGRRSETAATARAPARAAKAQRRWALRFVKAALRRHGEVNPPLRRYGGINPPLRCRNRANARLVLRNPVPRAFPYRLSEALLWRSIETEGDSRNVTQVYFVHVRSSSQSSGGGFRQVISRAPGRAENAPIPGFPFPNALFHTPTSRPWPVIRPAACAVKGKEI